MSETKDIARFIDHTLLKPDASRAAVEKLCDEALEYTFASVCVNPSYVSLCSELLAKDDRVKVCTVIGFPLGANHTQVKVFETKQAVQDGATEVDMVINVGAIKSGDWALVESDVTSVVKCAHESGAICKVILETCLLTLDEQKRACQICAAAGADFVKTSTGFSSGGATVQDIALMRSEVGPTMGVKASGGVRTLQDAQAMIAAGATRIGASAGVKIVQESKGVASDSQSAPSGY